MPIGGKSLKGEIKDNWEPKEEGYRIALELMLRIIQNTDEAPTSREADDKSLLLIKIDMAIMQENLPSIKADWIKTGNTNNLLKRLHDNSARIWTVTFKKYDGILIKKIT